MTLTTVAVRFRLAERLRSSRPRGVPLGDVVALLLERTPPEEAYFQLEARRETAAAEARERAAALAGAPATRRSPGEQRALATVAAQRFSNRLASRAIVVTGPRRYRVGALAGGEPRVSLRRRPR